MRGIYLFKLDEKNLEDVLGLEGIDFVWVASGDKKCLGRLKEAGLRLFYPVGIGGMDGEDEEKYVAVDKTGKKVPEFAGWYRGVCINNPVIRRKRLKKVKDVIKNWGEFYDGVYLDAIRYPTYWESKKVEYLDTCYCKYCKKLFEAQRADWVQFRINRVEALVREIREIVGKKTLGYFAVPENEEKLEKVFAQMPAVMSRCFDLVSPMLYPQMVGKDIGWCGRVCDFYEEYFGREKVVPIVQTAKMPEKAQDEFGYKQVKGLVRWGKKRGNFGLFALDLTLPDEGKNRVEVINSYLR